MTTATAPSGADTPAGAGPVDEQRAYRALASRDRRFDGRLWFGVTSTGIYCRPVCPARTPRPENVRVFTAPAAAVAAGFRACRRCRPDAQPGTRDWDHRGDLAGRAVRLIAAGAVDEDGVAGLAHRLHVSERHLHRTLVAEVGAGPLQLAMSRRAQTARLLVDQTDLPLVDVAFAAGFASLRQFNDVMRREFGMPPSRLRRAAQEPDGRAPVSDGGRVLLRLRRRLPYDSDALLQHLAGREVEGLERVDVAAGEVVRSLRADGAEPAVLRVTVPREGDHVTVVLAGAGLDRVAPVVAAVRRWLDLDADPDVVADVLGRDPVLAALVARRPGLRVPGTLDPWEVAVRAVVGQRVSVAAARRVLAHLVAAVGTAVAGPDGLTVMPGPQVLAAADPAEVARAGLPAARASALVALATAVADGSVALDPAGDRDAIRRALLAVPGIGPWTADYVALRGLGDPDAFPATDLGLRRAAAGLGLDPDRLADRAARWSPWRAYAAEHLWTQDREPREDTRS